MYHVYILCCSDGSYYVGHIDDLRERLEAHNAGRAAAWTARRRPLTLVY
jgi:predicted GIY-YIG superfamily endonuclease